MGTRGHQVLSFRDGTSSGSTRLLHHLCVMQHKYPPYLLRKASSALQPLAHHSINVPCWLCLLQVVYQDESLVQLLVSCQAHNYLEFKLVEGRCASNTNNDSQSCSRVPAATHSTRQTTRHQVLDYPWSVTAECQYQGAVGVAVYNIKANMLA